ncbi:MAG: hypothetical protein IJF49_08300 [Clostridia bacterium]|nr:hypothetical protein [Clostridia bacterium]
MKITLTAARTDDIEKVIRHAKALEERGIDEVEVVVDFCMESKPYLLNDDIMTRYGVGRTAAQGIVQSVKQYCGDSLGKGRVLVNELLAWERRSLDKQAAPERKRTVCVGREIMRNGKDGEI